MTNQKKLFPAKQSFEKGLEKILRGYESDRDDNDQFFITREWNLKHIKLKYWFMPLPDNGYDESEAVEISPKLPNKEDEDCGLVYNFNFDNEYMGGIDLGGDNLGFRYSAIFPDYNGPLDDKHTLKVNNVKNKKGFKKVAKYTVPKITREEFLVELKKIIDLYK